MHQSSLRRLAPVCVGCALTCVVVLGPFAVCAARAEDVASPQLSIRSPMPEGQHQFPPPGSAGRRLGDPSRSSGGWWLGTAGITLALAFFGAISLASRRVLPKRGSGPFELMARTSLSPKHTVHLLRAGDRTLIIGTGPQGPPALLGEWTGPIELLRPGPRRRAAAAGSRATGQRPVDRRPLMRPRHAGDARGILGWAVLVAALAIAAAPEGQGGAGASRAVPERESIVTKPGAVPTAANTVATGPFDSPRQVLNSAPAFALFALASLAPAALLMLTAFVRISIVLTLLRQALGSPQVPGNQVLAALALMLTALVMKPVADEVYTKGIEPYAAERVSATEALKASAQPIKRFMLDQIYRTGHEHYLRELYDQIEPPSAGRVEPTSGEQLDLRVVAPAFLLSELTTALMIGFAVYLPFLVIDLVVSAVLAAMGLFMMPPTLVALPLKLVVFVLADGWMLVAGMLLRSFGNGP